jgi:hypothetical protein
VKPYASGRVDPNRANVPVPDKRLDRLAKVFDPRRVVPGDSGVRDLAGIARDAQLKELAWAFPSSPLSRRSDALIHVLRAFRIPMCFILRQDRSVGGFGDSGDGAHPERPIGVARAASRDCAARSAFNRRRVGARPLRALSRSPLEGTR